MLYLYISQKKGMKCQIENENGFADDKHRGGRASEGWAVHRDGHSSRPTTMSWFRTSHLEVMAHAP